MKLGEVCLLTADVIRLADFYCIHTRRFHSLKTL